MSHPLDHLVASDLSDQVLQKQRRDGELPLPNGYAAHRVRDRVSGFFPIPNDLVRTYPESLSVAPVSRDSQER